MGRVRPCLRIIRAVFAALADPAGVTAHRPGALERAHLALGDWRDIRARLAGAETRMYTVMEEPGLADCRGAGVPVRRACRTGTVPWRWN